MKLFADKNLTKSIDNCFSFGIVPVGETKKITLWVKNDSSPKVTGILKDLEFDVICLDPENETVITDERIIILEAPKEMSQFAVAPISLEWTPNIDLEQGLKAVLNIKAKKIVG